MKTYWFINVYILTDSNGEWWESLKVDGSTRRFEPGSSEYMRDKEFKSADKALKHGNSLEIKRFQVIRNDPPIKPSITWGRTIEHDVGKPT